MSEVLSVAIDLKIVDHFSVAMEGVSNVCSDSEGGGVVVQIDECAAQNLAFTQSTAPGF